MPVSMSRALQVCMLSLLATLGLSLPAAAQATAPGALVKRLTIDEAVKLALEQNLGIQVERLNPQIQDVAVAQAVAYRVPTFTTTLANTNASILQSQQLAGGVTLDSNATTAQFGLQQLLKTGGQYQFLWNSGRNATTNNLAFYNPIVDSYLLFQASQPLFRNFKI